MQSLPENNNVSIVDITRAINELIRNLSSLDPVINPNLGKVEPEERLRRAGKTVYANGTDWNPGGGEGIYYRNQAGAWTKL